MQSGWTTLLDVEPAGDSAVFWRGIAIVAGLLTLLLVWALVRRRWASRSIRAWSGKGVHRGLDALRAGLLLRVHPSRLVAVAFEPLLADGRARILSVDPLRLSWPDPVPRGAAEETLARALDADGRIDSEGIFEFLDVLYREVDAALAPYSGRATAVHYRRRVASLWSRSIRSDGVPREDRPWLLLRDPEAVAARIRPTPAGEVLHDLLRLAEVFRAHLLAPREIADRAHGARSGFFRHRHDLDVVRTRRGERPERDRTKVVAESPFQTKLLALASSMDGEVTILEPGLPLLLHYAGVSPMVIGRHRGRVARVTLGPDGEVVADLTCSAAREFRVTPSGSREAEGTPDPADAFDARPIGGPGSEDWLELPRMRELIASLMPFVALEGLATRLRLRMAYDRDRFATKDILDRYSLLLTLAEFIEERCVASGALGPRGNAGARRESDDRGRAR